MSGHRARAPSAETTAGRLWTAAAPEARAAISAQGPRGGAVETVAETTELPPGETTELPRARDPGSGLGGDWRVIVLNDNHNTFDGVAAALSRVIPGVSLDRGYAIANKIHNDGQAIVWSGPREPAEHYWEQLNEAGLTMAPLERG